MKFKKRPSSCKGLKVNSGSPARGNDCKGWGRGLAAGSGSECVPLIKVHGTVYTYELCTFLNVCSTSNLLSKTSYSEICEKLFFFLSL